MLESGWGAFRSTRSPIPTEFSNPDINGLKTKSGIIEKYDDTDGSYKITVPEGAEVYLDGGGIAHITGVTIITHGNTKLNEGEYGVVTESPCNLCFLCGKPHAGSNTVTAAD